MGDGEAMNFLHPAETAPVVHVVRDGTARAKNGASG